MSTKKKQPTEPLLSEQISSFLNLLTQVQKDYAWNLSEQRKLEQLSQDYLHKLELEDTKYRDGAKISTQLKYIRRQRRKHKDSIDLLAPILAFAESPEGIKMQRMLSEKLGQTRIAERALGEKMYYFRVLKQPPIDNTQSNNTVDNTINNINNTQQFNNKKKKGKQR